MAKNEIRVAIVGDASRLGPGLANAEGDISRFSQRMEAIGTKMRSIGQSMTVGITLPVLVAGGAAFKMAADYADAVGATETVFTQASAAVKRWADTLPTYFGIAKDQALQYANTMGSLLMNIGGMSEDQAAMTSASLVQLAGDLSAMFGGSTDTAVQALTGALKGNNAMLDNYGIAANDALIKQKALTLGLWNGTGEMSLQAKQAATLALITEQTAKAQGQAGREANGASGSLKSMTTTLRNLAIDIGTMLLPVGIKLLGWVKDGIEWFKGLDKGVQKIILIVAGLGAVIGPVLVVLGTLATAISAISLPVLLVVAAIAALVAGFIYLYKTNDTFREWVDKIVGFIRDQLVAQFEYVRDNVIPALVAAFEWMKENVVPVVADLATLIATWWKFLAERVIEFVRVVLPVWQFLWNAIVAVVQFVWPIVQRIIENALAIIGGVIRFATAVLKGDWGRAWDIIVGAARVAWEWIKGVVSAGVQGVVGFVAGLPGRITGFFAGAWSWLLDAGRAIIGGLLNGIKEKFEAVKSFVAGIGSWIKDHKGPIDVDRRLLIPEGAAIMAGLAQGMKAGLADVNRVVSGVAPSISAGVGSAGGGPTGGAVSSPVTVNVTFAGPVAADSISWVAEQVETAVAKGVRFPRLARSMA